MGSPPKIVVGSDAIIAQANPDDGHHEKATKISLSLVAMGALVIYPATAIVESITFMQRVLSSSASAYATAVVFTGPGVQVAETNREILKAALKYFSPVVSKQNTLFDCIVAATAEEYGADAIFSFDKFYKSKGFKSAGELVK